MIGFLSRTGTLAAALAVVLAFPCYHLLLFAFSQIGLSRMLGLWGTVGLGVVGVAAILAALTAPWRPDATSRVMLALRTTFVLLGFANLAAVGFDVYESEANPNVQSLTWVLVLLLSARYVRLPEDGRRVIDTLFLVGGRVALLVPVAALPWVVQAYLTTPERIAAGPLPRQEARPVPGAPRRIVLLTFDALRARSVDLNDPAGRTPALAAIARQANVYAWCRAVGDRTQLSIPTMLTGVRPHEFAPAMQNRSGFIRQGDLSGVAAHLRPAGYRSHYVTMLINPGMFGVGSEFDGGHRYIYVLFDNEFNTRSFVPVGEMFHWLTGRFAPENSAHTRSKLNQLRASRETFSRARALLAGTDQPTFLWVHVAAPHEPYYDVPRGDPLEGSGPLRFRRVSDHDLRLASPARKREFEVVYERYVHFLDGEVERFVKGLQADGTWDDTLMIMTSDHGEQFVHGRLPHGYGNVSEDVTRVPLLIKTAGQRRPARHDVLVGTEDILPTILAQVYGTGFAELPGRTLLPPSATPPRTLYTWARFERFVHPDDPDGMIAAYRDGFKYERDIVSGREALFNLVYDPRAFHDVSARFPAVLASLRASADRDLAVDERTAKP